MRNVPAGATESDPYSISKPSRFELFTWPAASHHHHLHLSGQKDERLRSLFSLPTAISLLVPGKTSKPGCRLNSDSILIFRHPHHHHLRRSFKHRCVISRMLALKDETFGYTGRRSRTSSFFFFFFLKKLLTKLQDIKCQHLHKYSTCICSQHICFFVTATRQCTLIHVQINLTLRLSESIAIYV